MDQVLYIAAIIALLAFTFLCVYAIGFVKDASKSLKDVAKTLDEVKEAVIPALERIDDTRKQIISLSNSIERRAEEIGSIIKPLAAVSENLYEKLASPVSKISSLFSGVTKAIDTFSHIVKKDR